MTNTNRPYSPSPEYRYFLYDPNDGHTFYRTPEEREIAAKSLIKDYLVDGEWSEQVVDIYAGEATHLVSEVERIDKVGELDEDGYDENGEYWEDSDIECKCNYELQPLAQPAPAEPATSDDIPPGPFSEHDLREAWNGQADQFNQWDSLDTGEQLAWAQARAIAADQARQATPPAEGEAGELVADLDVAADLLRRQAAELAMLRRLAAEIEALVSESDGVAGLHLNGDLAPWDKLLSGGRLERLTLPDANV